MPYAALRLTSHGKQRLAQRGISEAAVRHVLMQGQRIKEYPDDRPHPSYLMLAWWNKQPLHVLVADDPVAQETILITAYVPSTAHWDADFKERRS
jgi:hypothetical protein